MKRLLATTALVATMATPVLAENHEMSNEDIEQTRMQINETMQSMEIDASKLIDARVYMDVSNGDNAQNLSGDSETAQSMSDDSENTQNMSGDSETAQNTSEGIADVPDTWEMVGEVDDVILTGEGQVNSLVIDAGGFLGMNETQKQVDLANVKFVADSDDEGEFFVVYTGSRSKFEETGQYDESRAAEQDMQSALDSGGIQSRDGTAPEVDVADLTTEELLGAAAYGTDNNWVGEVSELSLSEDGQVKAVIVDVGGFLGIGEKPVALDMASVRLTRTEGEDLRAYLSVSEDELEQMESWSGEEG